MNFLEQRLDKSAKTPLHLQLKHIFLDALRRNELSPGDILPNEEKLAENFRISKATVRQCMNNLATEGFVDKRRNRGTMVLNKKIDFGFSDSVIGFHKKVRQMGMAPRTKLLQLTVETPDKATERNLLLEPGSRVIHLVRLRYVNDEPMLWIESYLPYDTLYFLMGCNFETDSLYEAMDRNEEARVDHVVRTISATTASGEVAALFGVEAESAILTIESIAYNAAGRRVEYSLSYLPGGRNEYTFTVKR